VKLGLGTRSSYGEGVGFGALGFMSVALVGLFSSFLVARLYGVEVIGEFALVVAPSMTLWFLSSAREQAGLVRELSLCEPRAPRVTGLTGAVMAFSVGLTLVVALPVVAVTYFLYSGPIARPELFAPALVYIAGYTVLTNTCWNMDMVLTAFRAGRVLFWLRLHQILAYVAFAVIISYFDSSVWGLTYATVLSWATVTVHRAMSLGAFMRWSVPPEEYRAGFQTLPKLLRFGVRIVPGAIADGISQEVPIWVLGILSPVATVGAFSRAWLLSRRMVDLNYRITEMLFPTLVEHHATDDRVRFDRTLVDTLRLATYVLLLPAAAAGGAAAGVMGLYGPGFGQASDALAVLLTVPALSMMSQVQAHALLAVDRPLTTSKVSLVRMCVTVPACVLLVNAVGIVGAAVAIVFGYVVDLTIRFWITRAVLETRLTHVWPPRTMIALALAYTAGFAAARVVDLEVAGLLGALGGLVTGTVTYCAVLSSAGGLLPRDRDGLRALRRRLSSGRAGDDGPLEGDPGLAKVGAVLAADKPVRSEEAHL
jgi:O-antigen/teichoic acid export membrane protein